MGEIHEDILENLFTDSIKGDLIYLKLLKSQISDSEKESENMSDRKTSELERASDEKNVQRNESLRLRARITQLEDRTVISRKIIIAKDDQLEVLKRKTLTSRNVASKSTQATNTIR